MSKELNDILNFQPKEIQKKQQTMQRMFFDQQRELDKARLKLEECELADCFNHRDIESLREENAKLLKENAHLKKCVEALATLSRKCN